VDGLNLFVFVGNNPLNYFDDSGESKTSSQLKSEIVSGFKFLSNVHHEMKTLNKQLDDLSHPAAFRLNILKHLVYQIGNGATGWYSSFNAAGQAANAFPDFSGNNPHASGALSGMLLGNQVADASTGLYAKVMSPLKLNTPIVPDPSSFSAAALKERAGLTPSGSSQSWLRPTSGDELIDNSIALVSRTAGAYVPGVGEAIALAKVAEDANRAEEGLFSFELNEISTVLLELNEATTEVAAMINANYVELGIRQFYDESHHGMDYLIDLALGRVGASDSRMVNRAQLQPFKERAQDDIEGTRLTLARYRNHVAHKQAA
jgi:insecticidal toxin complex protein TccC